MKFLAQSLLLFLLVLAPGLMYSQERERELELINRPVNVSGLTGLLFTTSPYTVPRSTVELSAAAQSEQSTVPEYSLNEIPSLAITAGVSEHSEMALRGSYFYKSVENGPRQRGTGDTEISWKWNFSPQTESSSRPSLAFFLTAVMGTSDTRLELGGVDRWGAKTGLSAGREITWGDHIIGICADGHVVIKDPGDELLKDRYGVFNAGLIFPISKYRNLQMFLEYGLTSGIDRVGGDQTAITYGLRVVSERFNLTMGAQFISKDTPGYDNTSKVIGMMSIKL